MPSVTIIVTILPTCHIIAWILVTFLSIVTIIVTLLPTYHTCNNTRHTVLGFSDIQSLFPTLRNKASDSENENAYLYLLLNCCMFYITIAVWNISPVHLNPYSILQLLHICYIIIAFRSSSKHFSRFSWHGSYISLSLPMKIEINSCTSPSLSGPCATHVISAPLLPHYCDSCLAHAVLFYRNNQ